MEAQPLRTPTTTVNPGDSPFKISELLKFIKTPFDQIETTPTTTGISDPQPKTNKPIPAIIYMYPPIIYYYCT